MGTIKRALERFQIVVQSLDCECDGSQGFTCTLHEDRILVGKALEELSETLYSGEDDSQVRLKCAVLDMACVDCDIDDCTASGGFSK